MRLTKFFKQNNANERSINAWVKEKPKLRVILQIIPHDNGLVVLYEKESRKEEWDSVKRGFQKKAKNAPMET